MNDNKLTEEEIRMIMQTLAVICVLMAAGFLLAAVL